MASKDVQDPQNFLIHITEALRKTYGAREEMDVEFESSRQQ
jgi:hypothetical protein